MTAGGPRERPLLSPVAKAQEVLQAIRGYVRFFFGCRDCAGHFEQMAAASMHRVGSPDSAVLWLWSSHNKVNARLAGKKGCPQGWSRLQGEDRAGALASGTGGGRRDTGCPPVAPRGSQRCTVHRALPHALPAPPTSASAIRLVSP